MPRPSGIIQTRQAKFLVQLCLHRYKYAVMQGGVAEKFKSITEAYRVLSDDTARQDYDSTRFSDPWSWNGDENDDDVEEYEFYSWHT